MEREQSGDAVWYAHSRQGAPPEQWQRVEDHLGAVARAAARFAARFDAAEWGYVAGLWHDVGKFSARFQDYLRSTSSPDAHRSEVGSAPVRIDHSTAGARHAVSALDVPGHLIAYAIAGHHSGLLDGRDDGACQEARLGKPVDAWQHGMSLLPPAPATELPHYLRAALDARGTDPERTAFTFAFFVRMLFSCLVDADFLDTERFMAEEETARRPRWPKDILVRMEVLLQDHVSAIPNADTVVQRQRTHVRDACLAAAVNAPGLFSLTVPTGGGKTLSSLAFALRHARQHGLERVVYVIPFTSIIEQNAHVFRSVFSPLVRDGTPDPVIEHHSTLDVGVQTTESRLAAENWDAPLIVTTSVQFYESLFANRGSRCRKLHNLARAVVVLDEAQTLPVDLLAPCLWALDELSRNYGSSIVLCTATQPAIHRREEFPIGLSDIREIIPAPTELFSALKRVDVETIGVQTDAELTERLRANSQVLCIVNTRGHARRLYEALGEDEAHVHLSAHMCPEHRRLALEVVRHRLARGQDCRVVSTRLIEAGVDIDFPAVYRSLAGLDSIAQAAGRCNRNGRLAAHGRTFVFVSEQPTAEAFLRDTTNAAAQVLGLHDDALSIDAVEHYFRLYYWEQSARWDSKEILRRFRLDNDRALPFSFGFASSARDFALIDDGGEPVIIPWGATGQELCEALRGSTHPDTVLLRKLQRYTVSVPRRQFREAVGRSIELVHERFPVLLCPELHYSERFGLHLDNPLPACLQA